MITIYSSRSEYSFHQFRGRAHGLVHADPRSAERTEWHRTKRIDFVTVRPRSYLRAAELFLNKRRWSGLLLGSYVTRGTVALPRHRAPGSSWTEGDGSSYEKDFLLLLYTAYMRAGLDRVKLSFLDDVDYAESISPYNRDTTSEIRSYRATCLICRCSLRSWTTDHFRGDDAAWDCGIWVVCGLRDSVASRIGEPLWLFWETCWE